MKKKSLIEQLLAVNVQLQTWAFLLKNVSCPGDQKQEEIYAGLGKIIEHLEKNVDNIAAKVIDSE